MNSLLIQNCYFLLKHKRQLWNHNVRKLKRYIADRTVKVRVRNHKPMQYFKKVMYGRIGFQEIVN